MSYMPQRQAIAVFLALAVAYFLSTLVRAITATLAPTLVVEFALQARDLGLLAGGYFLGFAVMQLPLGRMLDRYGPKRVELGFLALAVLGCLAFAWAQSFVELLLARVLCGVGVCACLMAPLTAYRRWYAPGQQMRASSWMLMVGALGMVAATLPVQWLQAHIGWRWIFVLLALAVLAAMALMAWQLPAWALTPTEAPNGAAADTGYAPVWRHPYFRRMAPLGFFNYGGLVAMQTLWAGPWLVKVAQATPAQAAQGLFAINVCMLVAYWLWGWANPWLAEKGYSANRLIAAGVPVSLLLIAAIALGGPAWGTQASVLLWVAYCLGSTLCSLAQPAVAMAFPAALAGRALSAYNLLIFAGVFTVQWGVGLCIDGLRALGAGELAAYQGAFAVYGLCGVGAYCYFLWARQP